MKKRFPRNNFMLNIFNYIIAVAIFVLIALATPKPSLCQDFISDNEMWTAFPYPILGCRIQNIAILTELNRLKTSIRMGYSANTPCDIAGELGTLKVQQTEYGISFLMPIITKNHHFTLRFNSVENTSSFKASSKRDQNESAVFNLNTDYSSEVFLIAHYWKKFNVSWGGEIKLIDRGSETKTESALEVGWGDLSNSRLRFRYSREYTDTPWSWRLESDQMHGELNNIITGKLVEVSFGDPFGVHLTMVAGEEEIIKDDPSLEDAETITLESEFTRSYVSIKLKKNPPHKISWWFGGVHLSGSGELTATSSANTTIASSHQATVDFDEWGGKVNLPVGKYHLLSFFSEYFSWKIYTDGFLYPANLPFAFSDCFSDTTVFFLDSKVQGAVIRSEINRHRGKYNAGLRLGLSRLWVNGNIEDFSVDSIEEDPTRQTTLSLSEVTLGFLTLRANCSYRKITIGGSVSQAFLLNQQTDGRDIFGQGKQHGGTNGKLWLMVNF